MSIDEVLEKIHKTIYQFFDVCGDDEEVPISDKDKLLLEVNKAICDNLKALEQEPKTVLYSGDGYADGYMVYDMAECPNCGYEYEEGDKDWGLSFCPNCGQSLIWESEEQK